MTLTLSEKKKNIEAHLRTTAKEYTERMQGVGVILEIEKVRIDWKLKGSTAGQADMSNNRISLNPNFLKNDYESMLNQTSIHELAHLISSEVYGRYGGGHGRNWKRVMRNLGLEPKRCHKYDMSSTYKHSVNCGCGERHVSTRRFNLIVGGRKYTCKTCKEPLTLADTKVNLRAAANAATNPIKRVYQVKCDCTEPINVSTRMYNIISDGVRSKICRVCNTRVVAI